MRQGQKTQAVKILKRIAEIDDHDIDGVIAEAGLHADAAALALPAMPV